MSGAEAGYLHLDGLSKQFGATHAVQDVSLSVRRGEMIVLLGPSGCGKTTTLRMIAGFVEANGGAIVLDGQSIGGQPPHLRGMGMVFQSYALFPHMSVAANVAFGLQMRRMPRNRIAERVAEMLRLVKLEPFAERLPRHLSGGQQQRVALARALAIHPKLLLLDEPLSNLDAALRQEVAREIRILQRDNALTTVMVTHDQAEAMAMADRLVVMREGKVEQIGTQEDLYERPATPFVATFIGHSNVVAGTLSDGSLLTLADGTALRLVGRYAGAGPCRLAVRPERIILAAADGSGIRGRITLSTYLGATVEHVVRLGEETDLVVRGPTLEGGATRRFAVGDPVSVAWPLAGEKLFDNDDRPLPPQSGAQAEATIWENGVTNNA